MITTIDSKAAIVDQGGCFCEEGFRDLREGLISLMYEITASAEIPSDIDSLAQIIYIMRPEI